MKEIKETRGRKKNPIPSINKSLAIPHDIYVFLSEKKEVIEKQLGPISISKVAFKFLRIDSKYDSVNIGKYKKGKFVKVNWNIPDDIYRSLLEEKDEIERETGVALGFTKVLYNRLRRAMIQFQEYYLIQ